MNILDDLERLCTETAPSGFECNVSGLCAGILEPFVDEIYVDPMYNVVGIRRCGRENARKLMICAHIDEIGLIVTGHEEGFLRFGQLGGVDQRMLPGREVTVLSKKRHFGVIGAAAPHGASPESMNKSIPMKDLRIDVGLSQKRAEREIPVGTPVSFRSPFFELGKDCVCSKSLDDRACFLAVCRAAELLKDRELPWDVYFVGTISEEVGLRGATMTSFAIDPDVCIASDVCQAWTPDCKPTDYISKLGEGPRMPIGANVAPAVAHGITAAAAEKRIPVQITVSPSRTGTDAWAVQTQREGIATAVLSLPLRYMHTPQEVINLRDLELLGELMAEFALEPGEEVRTCLNI